MTAAQRISPAAPYVPTEFALLCHRCGRPYLTNTLTRSCCAPCQGAAAELWPGVVEPPLEMSGA